MSEIHILRLAKKEGKIIQGKIIQKNMVIFLVWLVKIMRVELACPKFIFEISQKYGN